MTLKDNFELLARYNQWMNESLFGAVAELDETLINKPVGVFFNSIFGTLNHIAVADLIWLRRFITHASAFTSLESLASFPEVTSLNEPLFEDFNTLHDARYQLDKIILDFCDEVEVYELNTPIAYTNMRGNKFEKRLGYLLTHFFNHQTHHRGQVSAVLTQMNIDTGINDLVAVIPEA